MRPILSTPRTLITLLVVASGALAPAATASAVPARAGAGPARPSIGVRLLDAPADEKNNPRARIYIIDFLPAGSVIHRLIQVTNYSASPRRIALYSGAASIKNGMFNVAAGRTPDELTTWIKLRPSLILRPRASARVKVTIAVPPGASPGERYAGIWAQTSAVPARRHGFRGPDGRHGRRGKGVIEVSRVGIRVYLAIGKGSPPASNFVIKSVTASRQQNGQPVVAAQVANTGGRALDLSGEIMLAQGPGSLQAGPFSAQLGTTIAPGQSEPVTVPLGRQLPDGPWKALIRLKSGLTDRSAQATITFPNGTGARTFRAETTLAAGGRYLIGTVVGALAALAALAFAVLRRNRRSIRGRAAIGDQP